MTILRKKEKEKVIVIYEECHGMIGIAKTRIGAQNFLVDEHWIGANAECVDDDGKLFHISDSDAFGSHWEKIIRESELDDDTISMMGFSFEEREVYTR